MSRFSDMVYRMNRVKDEAKFLTELQDNRGIIESKPIPKMSVQFNAFMLNRRTHMQQSKGN